MTGAKKKRSVAWKDLERTVARFFGCQRTALSGGNSKVTRSDTLHDELYVECKYMARSSMWTLYRNTLKKARAEKKVPVMAIKECGGDGFLIICHSSDLDQLIEAYKGAQYDDGTKLE